MLQGDCGGVGCVREPSELRVLIAAFGDPGHTFPGIALGKALRERGHRVVFETWEKWREVLDEAGIEFHAAEEYRVFAPSEGGRAVGRGCGGGAGAACSRSCGPTWW